MFIRCEAVSEFVLRDLWNWDQRKPSSRWCQRRMIWSWLRCCCKALWAHGADHLRCHNQSSNNKWLWYSGLPKVRSEEGRAPRGKSIQQLPQTQANLRVIVYLKGTGVSKSSKRYGACVPAGKKQANDKGSGRPRSSYLSPVNKSVSEEMWRHQKEPVPTKNWKMGRNPLWRTELLPSQWQVLGTL